MFHLMCSSGISSLLDSKARCFGVCDFAVLNWDYSLVLFIFFMQKVAAFFLLDMDCQRNSFVR